LQAQLDPRAFLRVHRSALVRLLAVRDLERLPGGDYRVRLHTGGALTMSRTHWPEFARAIGLKS